MKSKFLSIFLIVCVITVGAFSLSTLSLHMHEGGHLCPIAVTKGGECRSLDDNASPLSSIAFHISGMRDVVSASAGVDLTLLTIFLFLVIFSLSLRLVLNGSNNLKFYINQRHRILSDLDIVLKKFFHWIVIRNKRDYSHTVFGVYSVI